MPWWMATLTIATVLAGSGLIGGGLGDMRRVRPNGDAGFLVGLGVGLLLVVALFLTGAFE